MRRHYFNSLVHIGWLAEHPVKRRMALGYSFFTSWFQSESMGAQHHPGIHEEAAAANPNHVYPRQLPMGFKLCYQPLRPSWLYPVFFKHLKPPAQTWIGIVEYRNSCFHGLRPGWSALTLAYASTSVRPRATTGNW